MRIPLSFAAAIIAFSISAPVMSPRWTMRFLEWPPSMPNSKPPAFESRSNLAPVDMSLSISSGACFTMSSTASLSHRPSPASSVSFTCKAKLSFFEKTAAIPPCAKFVFDSSASFLVTRQTLPNSLARSAKLRPAIPEPITRKSDFIITIYLQ